MAMAIIFASPSQMAFSVGMFVAPMRGTSSTGRLSLLGIVPSQRPLFRKISVRALQTREESRMFWFGPPTGDLAEIEAFCRLHRLAENLHSTVMDALRSYITIEEPFVSSEPDRGDVSVVEEKVATGLAHIMTLLHEGKIQVLGATRVNQMEAPLDEPPPFARFRTEVRECGKSLEAALESLLPADSEQRVAVRKSMLKLKNACLDAGFPRPVGFPSHADTPNLAAVRLQPSRTARNLHDEEGAAFWRGGQVTEEGLQWILEKNFKVIVDMREESAERIAQSAIDDAVARGKLRVVRIPVDRGSQPTPEQVKEFAQLVADDSNRPLYLHTMAGVGRASAMVSKWREYVLRENLTPGTETKVNGTKSMKSVAERTEVEGLSIPPLQTRANKRDDKFVNGQLSITLASDSEKRQAQDIAGPKDVSASLNGVLLAGPKLAAVNGGLVPALEGIPSQDSPVFVPKNAFEAQRPGPNVLSRRIMSQYMKQKKSPSTFFQGKVKYTIRYSTQESQERPGDIYGNIAGPAGRWGRAGPGIPRAEAPTSQATERAPKRESEGNQEQHGEDGVPSRKFGEGTGNLNGYASADVGSGNAGDSEERISHNVAQQNEGFENISSSMSDVTGPKVALFRVGGEQGDKNDDGDEQVSVQGDMCASTTGVVRLQSRKKAEMFLVRTDGYSCTRERVKESTLAFTHPSTQQQMLMWKTPPRTCMVLKKLGDELLSEVQQVASYLHHQEGMNIVVEPEVHDRLARFPGFGYVQTFYSQDTSELHERVDFVVCLGGDGVILHASNLFRNAVPPVVSFNLGSLGFLTAHPFVNYKQDLRAIIHGHSEMMTGVYITLRMRLRCELYRNGKAIPGKVFDVLNEVVVDRGSNPYLCKIECYERNRLITKVQADGVIIATPTGSTAYSTSAGGSMVHPNVPCMLFTPICPHSLSFRPVILPDSALLELKVPRDARNNAWVSFDGKKRQQLSKGDSVRICMSEHPLPTVNKNDQTDDWFQSLVRCLNWNERLEQRPLIIST